MRSMLSSLCLSLVVLCSTSTASARAYDASVATPRSDAAHRSVTKRIVGSKKYNIARTKLEADYDRTIAELVQLTEIPAPPFGEEARGNAYLAMLKEVGLSDVERDAEGNVMGVRRGRGKGLMLVVAAHLDTVFPLETNVKVRRDKDRLYAPGIGDDTTGLVAILAYIRALDEAKIETDRDILFVANVGEEGPGDLRGMRYLFDKGRYRDRIGAFLSIESGRARVINVGVGSRRFKVTFVGPGGHSLHDFGLVNPAYALANAIQKMGELSVPKSPRTSYNIGVLEGGTSVNSIPFSVSMLVDMRSVDNASLQRVDDYLQAALPVATENENRMRSTEKGKVSYKIEQIGSRPVGQTDVEDPVVQCLLSAMEVVGVTPKLESASTDANIPMSKGIPAVTLGSGFHVERVHSLEENVLLDKEETIRHMSVGLVTIMAIAAPGFIS